MILPIGMSYSQPKTQNVTFNAKPKVKISVPDIARLDAIEYICKHKRGNMDGLSYNLRNKLYADKQLGTCCFREIQEQVEQIKSEFLTIGFMGTGWDNRGRQTWHSTEFAKQYWKTLKSV